jgi:hypothetical protein
MVIGCRAGLRFQDKGGLRRCDLFSRTSEAMLLGFREHDKAQGVPPGLRLVPLVPALKRPSPRCHFLRFGAVADAFTAITH